MLTRQGIPGLQLVELHQRRQAALLPNSGRQRQQLLLRGAAPRGYWRRARQGLQAARLCACFCGRRVGWRGGGGGRAALLLVRMLQQRLCKLLQRMGGSEALLVGVHDTRVKGANIAVGPKGVCKCS